MPDESTRKREQSTIGFPYHDLDAAVDVVKALYARSGLGSCGLDELAAEMGNVIGGTFRVKVAAARTFGLLDKDGRAHARLTELGAKMVSSEDGRVERVEAFMNVPLYAAIYEKYRGQRLPSAKALEREMEVLGVSPKQTDRARQAFERSARQAGYFEKGDDRLVRPNIGERVADTDREDRKPEPLEPADERNPGIESEGGRYHPLVQGLLVTLPKVGETWPVDQQKAWLTMAESIFAIIYKNADGTSHGTSTERKMEHGL